jgi:hypothetical protein
MLVELIETLIGSGYSVTGADYADRCNDGVKHRPQIDRA